MSQTSEVEGIRPVRSRRPSGRSPGNTWYRMTLYGSVFTDIKTTVKKGNGGANRGKRYSRTPLTDRGNAMAGLFFGMLDALGIPKYRSRFSNRIYSFWQKPAILALMSYQKIPYNDLGKGLGMFSGFVRRIGVGSIPHGSTMCKFAGSLDRDVLDKVVNAFSMAVGLSPTILVDTTCMSNFIRSAHYERRCGDLGRPPAPRTFTKLSLAVDRDTRLVVSAEAFDGNRGDITFMPKHVADIRDSGLRPSLLVADKGYDSDGIHRLIRDELGCPAAIPVRRSRGKRGFAIHGVYRNKMLALQEDEDVWRHSYGQRAIIESTNFMVKNRTGSNIRELNKNSRECRAMMDVIAFNIDRVLDLGLEEKMLRGFQ